MPGVLMCEAAAQLCSFFCGHIRLVKTGFVGFGGMEDVRFRGQVRPGRRLVLVSKAIAAASPATDVRLSRASSATTWSFTPRSSASTSPPAGETATPNKAARRAGHRVPRVLCSTFSTPRKAAARAGAMSRSRSRSAIDVSAHLIDPGRLREPSPPIDWPNVFGNDQPGRARDRLGQGPLPGRMQHRPSRSVNYLGIELSRKYAVHAAERLAGAGSRSARCGAATRDWSWRRLVPAQSLRGRARVLSRPVVEDPAQEAPGVHGRARPADRAHASNRRAAQRGQRRSRSTSG